MKTRQSTQASGTKLKALQERHAREQVRHTADRRHLTKIQTSKHKDTESKEDRQAKKG